MFIISSTSKVLALFYTALITMLWLGIGFLIPLVIGAVINKVILKGKNFNNLPNIFGHIAGIGFFAMFLASVGTVTIQIFSVSMAGWWYESLAPFGAIGFVIGVICTLFFGAFGGFD